MADDQRTTLTQQIQAQEQKIKQLKVNNAEGTVVDGEVAVLKGLKQQLDAINANSSDKKKKKAGKNAFVLKTPKAC